jgi:hypothetical protein
MNANVCADVDMAPQYASFLNIETPTIGCGLGKTCDNFSETPVIPINTIVQSYFRGYLWNKLAIMIYTNRKLICKFHSHKFLLTSLEHL